MKLTYLKWLYTMSLHCNPLNCSTARNYKVYRYSVGKKSRFVLVVKVKLKWHVHQWHVQKKIWGPLRWRKKGKQWLSQTYVSYVSLLVSWHFKRFWVITASILEIVALSVRFWGSREQHYCCVQSTLWNSTYRMRQIGISIEALTLRPLRSELGEISSPSITLTWTSTALWSVRGRFMLAKSLK